MYHSNAGKADGARSDEYGAAGLTDKVELFEGTGWLYAYVYYLNNNINYFHGHMLPSTGYITNFDIERFNGGFFSGAQRRRRRATENVYSSR
jgi:hypothetical protein